VQRESIVSDPKSNVQKPAADPVTSDLVESIHAIAEHLATTAPPRRVQQIDYMRTRQNRHKLTRTVYMSGAKVPERVLTDEEVQLLNQLKPGKYNEGRWTILERDAGGQRSLDILFPNATQEDRIRLMGEAPTLTALCNRVLAEQNAAK
jgi:hypothetical protein